MNDEVIIEEDDPWFGHFLRMTGVIFAQAVAIYACGAGLVWQAYTFSVTGYRKRDMLTLLVPIWGNVVQTRCLWRYTARSVYWEPRDDRPSDLLRGWQRPASIAAGWILLPIVVVASSLAGVFDAGWTESDRDELRDTLSDFGIVGAEAECVLAGVEARVDDPDLDRGELDDALLIAIDECEGER